MNLGLSTVGNNRKLVLGNFIIAFVFSVIAIIYGITQSGRYPTELEYVNAILGSFLLAGSETGLFFGINKKILEKKAE